MDKYNTVDKLTIEQTIDRALKQVVTQVKHWSRKELENLLDQKNQPQPLIVPLGRNCYLIGNYALRSINHTWAMIYRYNDQELIFLNRHAAIFYAICQQNGRGQLADEIYRYDQACLRINHDVEFYQNKLEHHKNKGNTELFRSRYLESRARLNHQRQLLEKSLKMAKYIKL